jgi:predicted transcriptional regulator
VSAEQARAAAHYGQMTQIAELQALVAAQAAQIKALTEPDKKDEVARLLQIAYDTIDAQLQRDELDACGWQALEALCAAKVAWDCTYSNDSGLDAHELRACIARSPYFSTAWLPSTDRVPT